MNACTIVARNYIAFARVLARSFLEHHPGSEFTVLVIDDERRELDDAQEPFRAMRLVDLRVPLDELHRMAMVYDVTEFATALKPSLLRRLLEDGRPVVYLDPDIQVFDDFGEVDGLCQEHGIVLVPHVLSPMPRDGLMPEEYQILISGIFNLGFIGVGSGSEPFLDWWAERLERDAVIDPCNGLFTDQRWVDFVPALFDHHVLRDPSLNAAYWNLYERPLTHDGSRYLVAGRPLRFYHFSGFDPRRSHLLSKHQGERPRVLLSELPVLARLCREYAALLRRSGHDEAGRSPYGFATLPNGLPVERRMRVLYRSALLDSCRKGSQSPPDPFAPGGADALVAWLLEPVVPPGPSARVPRYLAAHWRERPDLQIAFPNLGHHNAEHFLQWAAHDEGFQNGTPAALRSLGNPMAGPRALLAGSGNCSRHILPGVTIAGYFHAELGVGQAGRLLVAGLEQAGIPFSTATYDQTLSRQEHPFAERGGGHRFDVNLLCVNADQTAAFVRDAGQEFFADRHNIGLWFWETDVFPPAMRPALDLVDEVWAASHFTREAIAAVTTKPVHLVPLPVLVPTRPTSVTRAELGLPDGFLFLFTFDFFSVAGRKNPLAVIEAFGRAFAPGEGASLVVKTMNGAHNIPALEELRMAAAVHPDVQIVDRCFTSAEMRALTSLSDCTVSLHRSEGFGLTMFEAMAMAKPVIATGYSGNVTFMDDHNAHLVPYDLVRIGPGHDPYPPDGEWAEPRTDVASRLMRLVFDDQEAAAALGREAQRDLRQRFDVARTAEFVTSRLEAIRRARAGRSSVGASQ